MNCSSKGVADLPSYHHTEVITTPMVFTSVCTIIAIVWGFDNPNTALQSLNEPHPLLWISTHFSHSNINHLVKNIMALWLLNYLFPIKLPTFITASMFCVPMVGCYAIWQDIQYFLGLSALLYIFPGYYYHRLIKLKTYLPAFFILFFLVSYFLLSYLIFSNNELLTPLTEQKPFIAAHAIGFISGIFAYYFETNHK